MKIVIIPSWFPPDGGTFFFDRAKSLQRNGHEVSIIYVKPFPKSSYLTRLRRLFHKKEEVTIEEGLVVYRSFYSNIPRTDFISPFFYAMECRRMFLKYILRVCKKPDLIIANSSVWGGVAAAKISKEFEIPFVITEHRGRFTLISPKTKKMIRWWYHYYLNQAFLNVGHVIFDGSLLINGIKRYLRKDTNWSVISNGVDSAFFSPSDLRDKQYFTIITIGDLNYGKGIDLLLAAFKKMHDEYQNTRLLIRGGGPEKNKFEEFVLNNNLTDSVVFLNRLSLEGLRDLYCKADLFVLPSRFEGQGLVYIEAMSCGVPVVSTKGVPPESCPNFAGLRIEINNVSALTDALYYMYHKARLFDKNEIRDYVTKEHDISVVTEKFITICENVVERAKSLNSKL